MIKHRGNGIFVFQLREYDILRMWLQLILKCFILSISYLNIDRFQPWALVRMAMTLDFPKVLREFLYQLTN